MKNTQLTQLLFNNNYNNLDSFRKKKNSRSDIGNCILEDNNDYYNMVYPSTKLWIKQKIKDKKHIVFDKHWLKSLAIMSYAL